VSACRSGPVDEPPTDWDVLYRSTRCSATGLGRAAGPRGLLAVVVNDTALAYQRFLRPAPTDDHGIRRYEDCARSLARGSRRICGVTLGCAQSVTTDNTATYAMVQDGTVLSLRSTELLQETFELLDSGKLMYARFERSGPLLPGTTHLQREVVQQPNTSDECSVVSHTPEITVLWWSIDVLKAHGGRAV
jgi:hypothetical protein